MDEMGREKSPWEGFWVICGVMIFMPLLFRFIVGSVMRGGFGLVMQELNQISARAVGLCLGTVFHLGCLVSGVFTPSFKIVTTRLKEFFETLTYAPKIAVSEYWWNLKQTGFAFWVYMAIMAGNVWIWVNDLITFVELYKYY